MSILIRALIIASVALSAAGIRCYECVYTRDLGEYKGVFGKNDEKCQNPTRRHSVERNGSESGSNSNNTTAKSASSKPGNDSSSNSTTTAKSPSPESGNGTSSGLVPTCVKMEALVVRQLGHLKAALGPVIIRTMRMYPKDQPLICENIDSPLASNWSTDPLVNKIHFAKGRLCLCRARIPPNWKPECNGASTLSLSFSCVTLLALLISLF